MRTTVIFNVFLSHKIENKSLIEILNPEAAVCLVRDRELLTAQNFGWEDIDIPTIESRVQLLQLFTQELPPIQIPIINTRPLEHFFPLKFIDLICKRPNNWFQEVIFKKSLCFYTLMTEFFIWGYLEKDLYCLDKLESLNLESYNLIERIALRERNLGSEILENKYLNEIFHVKSFALNLVDQFVYSATWRWVSEKNNVHVNAIKICKILMEYQLFTLEEAENLKKILLSKLASFIALEKSIEKNARHDSPNFTSFWLKCLQSTREYIAEILLQYVFLKLDNEVQRILKKSTDSTNERINVFIQENENAYQFKEFLLNYLLDQKKIGEEYFLSEKAEEICIKLMRFIGNKSDSFSQNIRYLKETNYLIYKNYQPNSNKIKIFNDLSKELTKILNKTSLGNYIYREEEFAKHFAEVLSQINKELVITSQDTQYNIQKMLSNSHIPNKIIYILGLYSIHFEDFKKLENRKNIFLCFSEFFSFFMEKNFENSAIFLNKENFSIIANLTKMFPLDMLSNLEVLSKVSEELVFTKQGYFFEIILEILPELYIIQEQCEKYPVLIKVFNLLSRFLSFSQEKSCHSERNYDLKIAEHLIHFSEFLQHDKIIGLFNESKEENLHILSAFKEFLTVLVQATEYRMSETVYNDLLKCFTLQNFKVLFSVSEAKNFGILYSLFGNLYIDSRASLIKKPAEDDFNYEKTIENIIILREAFNRNIDKTKEFFFYLIKILRKLSLYMVILPEEKFENSVKFDLFIEELEALQLVLKEKKQEIIKNFLDDSTKLKILESKIMENNELFKKKFDLIDKVFHLKYNKVKFKQITNELLLLSSFLLNIPLDNENEMLLNHQIEDSQSTLNNLLVSAYKNCKIDVLSKKNNFFSFIKDKTYENEVLIEKLIDFSLHLFSRKVKNKHNFVLYEFLTNADNITNGVIRLVFIKKVLLSKDTQILFELFHHFDSHVEFVKEKNDINHPFYFNDYQNCLLFLDFYKTLPNIPKENEIKLIVTFTENLLKSCNLTAETIKFELKHRPHMFKVLSKTFELLTGFFDVCIKVKSHIYTNFSAPCKAILQCSVPHPLLWELKVSIINYLIVLAQENNIEIANFQSTNYEISLVYSVFLQCFHEHLKNFSIKIEYKHLLAEYKRNISFSNSLLMKICTQIFIYFKYLAEIKSRYELFFKERQEALDKNLIKSRFSNEELQIFCFFNNITQKIEVSINKFSPLGIVYFSLSPKFFFITNQRSKELLENIIPCSPIDNRKNFLTSSQLYHLETKYNYHLKKERDINFNKAINFGYIINIFLCLMILGGFSEFLTRMISILAIFFFSYGFIKFYQRKFQILKSFYLKKTKFDKRSNRSLVVLYESLCLQREFMFIWFFCFVLMGIIFHSYFYFISLLAFFRLFSKGRVFENVKNGFFKLLINITFIVIILFLAREILGISFDSSLISSLIGFFGVFIFFFLFVINVVLDFLNKNTQTGIIFLFDRF